MDYLVEMNDLFDCVKLPVEFQVKSGVDYTANKGKPSFTFTPYTFDCTIIEKDNFEQDVKKSNLFSSQYLGVWILKSDLQASGYSYKDMDDARLQYEDELYRVVGKRPRNNLSNYVEFICGKEGNQ